MAAWVRQKVCSRRRRTRGLNHNERPQMPQRRERRASKRCHLKPGEAEAMAAHFQLSESTFLLRSLMVLTLKVRMSYFLNHLWGWYVYLDENILIRWNDWWFPCQIRCWGPGGLSFKVSTKKEFILQIYKSIFFWSEVQKENRVVKMAQITLVIIQIVAGFFSFQKCNKRRGKKHILYMRVWYFIIYAKKKKAIRIYLRTYYLINPGLRMCGVQRPLRL